MLIPWLEAPERQPKGSPKAKSPVWGRGWLEGQRLITRVLATKTDGAKKGLITDHIEGKPVPGLGGVDGYPATGSKRIELLQKEIYVLVNNVLLVPKGSGAEGMREGPPLCGMHYWITDPDDAWLACLVPLILKKPRLTVRHVSINITIRLRR
jgi:hypothetical protein